MPVSRRGKAYFTQDQYDAARRCSALEYAQRRGYDLVPSGHRFTLREHDSMVFLPNGKWFWNSRGLRGGALEFAQKYEGLPLAEAVLAVIGEGNGGKREEKGAATQEGETKKAVFRLPAKEKDDAPLFIYLTQTRRLDWEIVRTLIEQERIYLTKQCSGTVIYRNAVFVGYKGGEARAASLRGIAYGSSYKGEAAGSDKSALFAMPEPGASCLAVFEGAIDAISHASLQKRQRLDWHQTERIAQGGAAGADAVEEYLKERPRLRTVRICFDNDAAGRALEARLRAALQGKGYEIISEPPPAGKDWNEYLIQSIALRGSR